MRRLAFVCTANICRSPAMRHAFTDAVSQRSDADQWAVGSRGTHAIQAGRICELSAELMGGADEHLVRVHRSKAVSERFVRDQHLILTATRTERAELATLAPAARSRTFTLREATWLGAAEPTSAELERAGARLAEGCQPLQAYADLLHWRRGLTPQLTSRPKLGLGRATHHLLDIDDGHLGRHREHQATLRVTDRYSRLLATQLIGFLDSLEQVSGPR